MLRIVEIFRLNRMILIRLVMQMNTIVIEVPVHQARSIIQCSMRGVIRMKEKNGSSLLIQAIASIAIRKDLEEVDSDIPNRDSTSYSLYLGVYVMTEILH